MNVIASDEIPMGFGMALAQNTDAMQYFSNLSAEEQRAVIAGTHSIRSKAEMQSYVSQLKNRE